MVSIPPSAKRLLHHDYNTPTGHFIHEINIEKQSHKEKTIYNQQILPRIQAISLIFASIYELAEASIIAPFEVAIGEHYTFTKMFLNSLTLLITSIFRIIFNALPEVDYISGCGLEDLIDRENSKCIEHILQGQKERLLNTPGATTRLLVAAMAKHLIMSPPIWRMSEAEKTRRETLQADARKLISVILELDPTNSFDHLMHEQWIRASPEFVTSLLKEIVDKRKLGVKALVFEATTSSNVPTVLAEMIADFESEDIVDPFTWKNFTELITTKDADHAIALLQAKKRYLQKYPDVTRSLFNDALLQYNRLTIFAEDLKKAEVPQLPPDVLVKKQNDLKEIMQAIIEINPNIKALQPPRDFLERIPEFQLRNPADFGRVREIWRKYDFPSESYNKLSRELFVGPDMKSE